MVASTCGSISAEAAPWATRAATRVQAVGGDAAGERGDAEGGHADEEEPAPAGGVAEPAAEDEEHRVGDSVAGDDQFEHGRAGGEVAVDGGERHVDDEEVDQRQGGAQQDREQAERADGGFGAGPDGGLRGGRGLRGRA
ncbi:hypothetical protein GCM10020254_76870 [Streptomyces goshikiensis]